MEERQKEIFELQMLEMQLKQLEQSAIMLEQQVLEAQTTIFNLDEMKKAQKGQPMLFPVSKEIFIEGKVDNLDSFLVSVGGKVAVKKSLEETKKFVEKQKEKLIESSYDLQAKMEEILQKMAGLEHKLNCNNPHHHH